VDDTAIVISASIGTTIYPADGKNCSELIKQADISMYLAKTRSKLPIVNRL
jgi:GGDEF domain-containing protein